MSLTVTRRPQQADTLNKWSCVNMPVIYELTSNKYPTNTADSSSGVASYNSNNGYLRVDLGSIGTINELDFVKIVAPNATEYEGVHQVLQVESGNVYTLDIAYTSGTINWTGSAFTKYYPNYHAVVRIYAGIDPSHPLYSDKPIELAAELKIVPDADGKCLFSIHEILRAYVRTKNTRVDTGTIGEVDPYNDIDFFTHFYIAYAESYDESNAYTINTYRSPFVTDTFIGVAVNAALPFRNSNGTFLTEYMNNKFITLFAIPVLFACSDETPLCFQDVSIIAEMEEGSKFKQEYYSDGVRVTETLTDIPDHGDGVYRMPLTEADCEYDRVDVSVTNNFDASVEGFANNGSGTSWQADGAGVPFVDLTVILGIPSPSKFGYIPMPVKSGQQVSIPYQFRMPGSPFPPYTLTGLLTLFDSSFNIIHSASMFLPVVTTHGTYTGTYIGTPNRDAAYYAWRFTVDMEGTSGGDLRVYFENIGDRDIPLAVTEIKTFEVSCGCANQEMRLAWFNNLGGIDYWNFTAQKEFGVDIMRTEEVSLNKLLLDWANDDTIRKETARDSREYVIVRSQHLTLSQLQAIKYIRSSVLVQQIFSAGSRRTVLVDNSSFRAYDEGDKLYTVEFKISFTDDIPALRA